NSSSASSIRREFSTTAACILSYDGNSLMQTALADFIRDTPEGREADAILRKCVHCGFCTATCPTYLLLGDENDGPRGRIYLMKQVLEGQEITDKTRLHLDRCLTCRACETTCPSGVQYGRLLDRIGISVFEAKGAGCCGALRFHIGYQEEGLADMRALIDRWWPMIERGEVEAIVMTASGCGVVVKEYAHLLRHDPAYAGKAEKISTMTRDVCEVIEAEFGRIEPILARKKDRKSTRLNSSHGSISYAVFCLKKKI